MHRLKLISRLLFCAALVLTVTASAVPVPVLADESSDSSEQSLPWPDAPGISAEGAILVEAESGAILYGKNIHEAYYPASITKLLTGLIAYENLDLTDTVTLSEQAVYSIPWDGTNIGMDMGESITVEQALYGLMVASANEVANGLAEKISGSQSDFADLMNQRAAELGCRDSHFVNAHGLFDSDHYVSPYDMAQIARAYFSYDDLCDIAGTVSYHFVATDTQPDDFWLNSRNRLVNGNIEYDGIVGGKTGYTDEARETLVTCAERDGMKLICVILKDEPPYHFDDTVTLLDYGFDNFQRLTVDSLQGGGAYPESGFMTKGNDIFGNSASPLAIDSKAGIVIPKDADASMVTSSLVNSNEYVNIRLSLKKTNEVRLSGITDPASQSAEDIQKTEEKTAGPETYGNADDTIHSYKMGAVQYHYGDRIVGNAEMVFNDTALRAESADLSSTGAAADENAAAAGTNQFLPAAGGSSGSPSFFRQIIHIGNNGTLYINIISFLLIVSFLAAAAIAIIMTVSYRQFLNEDRSHRKRRPDARRKSRSTGSRSKGRSTGRKRTSHSRTRTHTAERNSRTEDNRVPEELVDLYGDGFLDFNMLGDEPNDIHDFDDM